MVQNGVWVRQESVFDSPLNLGAHCAKGASVRHHTMTADSHRLKYPVKLEGGKWKKISWDQAYDEISQKLLKIREESGPDALFILGSSKHNNEQSYLLRKWLAMWGSNNVDHQARICHSTTVAGIANTWGYGAMTNSYNDEQNSKCLFFLGSNAAEAHPVSMLHTLHAKENGAKVIVADPRYTRTAAHADKFVRIRSGSDVAFQFGLLYHIFKNGWEDKKYIHDRVYGMDQVKAEVMAKYTPQAVEEVTGVSEKDMYETAKMLSDNRPGFIIWAMGQTQHTNGNNVTRASAVLMLALGNAGITGGGANIYRGHDNVQGATDIGPNAQSLPGYYGLSAGAWKHWARVWNVDLDWLKKRFKSEAMMGKFGFTVSRWADAVLEKPENIDQDTNVRAVIFWGHAPNSQTRGLDQVEAMKKLDMMVVIDPYPSASASMFAMVRQDGAYLLPAATQFETYGSVTASNRSLQWREKVVEPVFECAHRPHDHVPAGAEARLRRRVRGQEGRQAEHQAGQGQGRDGRARDGGHAARGQQRHLDHRLHRPVARADQGAHAQHARVRRQDAARARRQGQGDGLRPDRRLLRPAVAVLGQPVGQAPGHAEPVRHLEERDGRRRHLPRPLRRGARRRQPAGRGRLALGGQRDHHRLPRVHAPTC